MMEMHPHLDQSADAFFALLIEQMPDGLLVLGPSGVIRFANPGAAALLGQACEVLAGRHFAFEACNTPVVVTVDDVEAPALLDVQAANGRWCEEVVRIVTLRRPPLLPALADVMQKLHASEEQLRRLVASIHDAVSVAGPTGRLSGFTEGGVDGGKLEPAQWLSHTLLYHRAEMVQQAVLDHAGECILATDTTGRLTLLNRAAERMLGYRADEIVGTESATLFLSGAELATRLQELAAAGEAPATPFLALVHPARLGKAAEWTLRCKDGSEFSAWVTTAAMYDGNGLLTGYTAVASDITPFKQAEENLRCSQEALRVANSELARALSFRNEFLASMSHELRTPLAAILNLTEALTDYVQGPLNPQQMTYVQTISESSRHLLNVINDILDIAKIEAGHMQLDLEPVSVEAVCYACMRLIREQAKRKKLTPTLDIDLEVTTLRVDERRLKQMLVNLLGNAIKFTPGGGAFGLEVRGERATQMVRFTVWDTGIGIRPDDLPHLFQPFVQLESSLARQQEGAGLGLALVRRMAELHGGHIEAQSEPGQGSRFTVVLPWDEETEEETRLAMPDVLADGSLVAPGGVESHAVILLVEDNEATSLAIRDYLALRGYRVYHARDGLEALEMARTINPDLILLDVQMPALDGFETVRRLRQIDELQAVTVVALTALVMRGDRERCLAAGMNDYISKPISLHNLVQIIERNVGANGR